MNTSKLFHSPSSYYSWPSVFDGLHAEAVFVRGGKPVIMPLIPNASCAYYPRSFHCSISVSVSGAAGFTDPAISIRATTQSKPIPIQSADDQVSISVMDQFIRDPRGLADYLNDSERSYHPNNPSLAVNMRDTMRTGSSSTRSQSLAFRRENSPGAAAAAMAAAQNIPIRIASPGAPIQRNNDSPYPTVQRTMPKTMRDEPKPVPQAKKQAKLKQYTAQELNSKPLPPTPTEQYADRGRYQAQETSSSRPRTQSPAGKLRVVHRNAEGKFDPSLMSESDFSAQQGYVPPSRPSSPSSWSTQRPSSRNSKADSTRSNPRPGSRRGSLADNAKRLSDWVKDKSGIIMMSKTERTKYERQQRLSSERHIEEQRRHSPASRPLYQQEALVAKQNERESHNHYAELDPKRCDRDRIGIYEREVKSAIAQLTPEQRAVYNRYEADCARAAAEGRQCPDTPQMLRDAGIPARRLTSIERNSARVNYGIGRHADGAPGPTKATSAALNISKLLDPIKPRGRSDTLDSDMDFGMTDMAPAGTMLPCSVCKAPVTGFLKDGLCELCYEHRKKQRK